MEELYYILDIETNLPIIENLTYQEGINWLIENGVANIHILTQHTS